MLQGSRGPEEAGLGVAARSVAVGIDVAARAGAAPGYGHADRSEGDPRLPGRVAQRAAGPEPPLPGCRCIRGAGRRRARRMGQRAWRGSDLHRTPLRVWSRHGVRGKCASPGRSVMSVAIFAPRVNAILAGCGSTVALSFRARTLRSSKNPGSRRGHALSARLQRNPLSAPAVAHSLMQRRTDFVPGHVSDSAITLRRPGDLDAAMCMRADRAADAGLGIRLRASRRSRSPRSPDHLGPARCGGPIAGSNVRRSRMQSHAAMGLLAVGVSLRSAPIDSRAGMTRPRAKDVSLLPSPTPAPRAQRAASP